jgi:hypothetical protein
MRAELDLASNRADSEAACAVVRVRLGNARGRKLDSL